jgi:hypothetical protein
MGRQWLVAEWFEGFLTHPPHRCRSRFERAGKSGLGAAFFAVGIERRSAQFFEYGLRARAEGWENAQLGISTTSQLVSRG